jgi:glycosyltransferase involved in cell wall biosynthesis
MTSDYTMALRFSIIVPTRNRAALLDVCLRALEEMDYPQAGFEVLVVDDGSEPPVGPVVARYAGQRNVRYLRTEGVGPATARNLALSHAAGEYVVFTDDDCRPHPQWLSAFEAAIARSPNAGFGGQIVDSPHNSIFGRTSQMLVSFLYAYSQANQASDAVRFFCSNNLAFPRRPLQQLGGFDESFPLAAAEDRYLCAQWLRQGSLVYVPEAVVEHRQMLGLGSYLRQQFRYGRGARQFWLRRGATEEARNRLEPWHFYRTMLGFPFGKVSLAEAIVMSVLLAASQIAVGLGYYTETFQPSPQMVPNKGPKAAE